MYGALIRLSLEPADKVHNLHGSAGALGRQGADLFGELNDRIEDGLVLDTGAKLKALGLQPGWPDFLLLAPAAADRPGGLVHMLELKRRGEDLTKSQEDLAAWCAEHVVPFACNDDLLDAIATLSGWGVLRLRIAQ